MYHKTILDNGLRILTTPMPHTHSVGVGIFTAVGSRYESKALRGISHFIEHMVFKGTQRRPTAQQIAESIEGLGGLLNAGTGSEMTTYWAKVAHHHLPVAFDVLADIFRHSKFDTDEVEKERQVILQEISRLKDDPGSWVHVLIDELIWPDHPVGWEIAGTKESVSSIQRQDMLEYMTRTYTPHNTVVSVAGNLDHARTVGLLKRELADWEVRPVPSCLPAMEADAGPSLRVAFKETEQAHLCVGMRGLSINDPEYFGLRILNVILGEGMSSRLFLEIREKRGLAYSVGSYTSFLSDTGAMVLHAGVPPQQTGETISVMMEQLDLLRARKVAQPELTKAKEFLKGRILLRMEDTFANAQWFGKQEVLNQKVLTVNQVIERLDAVAAADVQRLAQQLFVTEQLRLAVIGPFKQEEGFAARLSL